MSRLLTALLAIIAMLAGLAALAAAAWAAWPGAAACVNDPALRRLLAGVALPAAGAATLALVPGLTAAAAIRHASPRARLLVLGIALCLLLLPAPALAGWPDADATRDWHAAGFAIAALRGAALVLLITAPAAAAITPGLRQAARLAGADPFCAWRHAVLAQIWRPACLAWLAAAVAALAQTPVAGLVMAHLDPSAIWLLLASLLLVACSVLALRTPRRAARSVSAYLQ